MTPQFGVSINPGNADNVPVAVTGCFQGLNTSSWPYCTCADVVIWYQNPDYYPVTDGGYRYLICKLPQVFSKVSESEVNINGGGTTLLADDVDTDGGLCQSLGLPIPWVVLNGHRNWPDGPYAVSYFLVGPETCSQCNGNNDFGLTAPYSLDGGYGVNVIESTYCEARENLAVSLPLYFDHWTPQCLPDGGVE